jgi:hypothetical protein
MALFTSLSALSQTPASNAPDGSVDAPSTIDDQLRLLASFIALVRDEAHVYVSSVAGTNTITGTIPTNPTSYVVGRVYRFVAAAANAGAVTLNFNSLGAKSLLKVGNVALTGGELQGTSVYSVVWDGVNFQLTDSVCASLGYAQSWQNVTGSRALGTTYTNTTGRPINVAVSYTVSAPTTAQPVVGGLIVPSGGGIQNATLLTANFIVPPGATYSLPNLNYSSGLYWVELR